MKWKSRPRLYQLGLRFPRAVLASCILLVALSLWGATKLRMENDLVALLPPDFESVQALQELRRHFGGLGFLVVAIESDSADASERFADAFAERIERLPSVQYVDHRRPIAFFEPRQWLYLDLADLQEMERRLDRSLELQAKGVSPHFNELMDFADVENRPDLDFEDIQEKYRHRYNIKVDEVASTDNGSFIAFKVKSKTHQQHLDASRNLLTDIQEIESSLKAETNFGGVSVHYTGDHVEAIDQVEQIKQRMAWVTFCVVSLLLLVLLAYFRRFRAVWLIVVPLATGIIWTAGVIYLSFGHLNIITGFAAGILAGLGSDYGIYLMARYFDERRRGTDFATACEQAFRNTGRATYAAMLTTVFAFLALLFSNFGMTVELGIVGAAGLVLNYLAMMLMLPALLVLVELRPNVKDWDSIPIPGQTTVSGLRRIFLPRGAMIGSVITVFLCLLSLWVIPDQSTIHFEDGRLDHIDTPAAELYSKVAHLYGGSLQPTLLITKGKQEDLKTIQVFQKMLETHPANQLPFKSVIGLSSFLPEDVIKKKAVIKRLQEKFRYSDYPVQKRREELISSLGKSSAALAVQLQDLPVEVTRLFVSPFSDDIYAVFVYPNFTELNWEWMQEYSRAIKSVRDQAGLNFAPVDNPFVATEFVAMIQRIAPTMLLTTLVFILGTLLCVIRPIGRALLLFGLLFGGLILLCGVLWLFDIPFNTLNIAALPIILGTGIDSFVHFSTGFDELDDIRSTLATKLPSVLLSNATSIIGFGGLLFVPSAGLRSLGWVILLGLIMMTALCAFVLPRALLLTSLKRPSLATISSEPHAGDRS